MSLTKITNRSLAGLTVLNSNIADNTISGNKLISSTITRDKMALDALDSVPIGTIIYFAGNTPPVGYLVADGSILDRNIYVSLFNVIGTLHNRGTETGTQFRIPDLRGEFIRGWDGGRNIDTSRVFGSFQDYDWKGFWQTNTGQNSSGGYTHNDEYMGKTQYPNYTGRLFMGYWSNPSAHLGTAWDASEIRPRNIALLPCIKFSDGAMLSQNAINVQSLAATKLNITGGTINGSLVTSQNPKFYVSDGPAQSTTGATATVIQFSVLHHNIGNGFNLTTNRFTAPVTGYYQFTFNAMCGAANFFRYRLYKNGALYGPEFFAANQTYENFGGNWQVYLDIGDYVDLRFGHAASEVNNIHVAYRAFSGFLIP